MVKSAPRYFGQVDGIVPAETTKAVAKVKPLLVLGAVEVGTKGDLTKKMNPDLSLA